MPDGSNGTGQPAASVMADPPLVERNLPPDPVHDPASDVLQPIRTAPYDPSPEREAKRGVIALLLVFALCGMILLSFLFVFLIPGSGHTIDDLKALLELIFAPIVGLVGAVTGFYFGEKSR